MAFEEPPDPISYEQFLGKFHLIEAEITAEVLAFFKQQSPQDDPDLYKRVLYALFVTKFKYPDIPPGMFLYVINYRIALDGLKLGGTPEQVMASIRSVDWDAMPGMDVYQAETGNSIARRAFEDAVAGTFRGPIIQEEWPGAPRRPDGDDGLSFSIDTNRF